MAKRIVYNQAQLRAAIDDCRKQKVKDQLILAPGDYFLTEPLELCELDNNLVLEGQKGVSIFGGKRIEGWVEKEGLYRSVIPEVKDGSWDFRSLIVNGRFADRSRYPESGFLLHKSEFDVRWKSTYEGGFERQPSEEELTTLEIFKEDIPEGFVPENAEITVFHMWDESLVGVASIHREKGEIKFSTLPGWPPGAFTKEHNFEKRYLIWNTEEGLTRPGQWYLDRKKGELVYYPLKGEHLDSMHVIAPVLNSVIRIRGIEKKAEHITLKNLHISSTNAPLMSGAFGAKLFDGAVSVTNALSCTFENLSIKQVGAHCLKADGDKLTIKNCEFSHAGAGAIRLTGSNALIRNNHIHHIGKTFPSAIALYVGATDPNVPEEWLPGKSYSDCILEHNEIHHVPYAAICAGGKNLLIQKNLIYEAMQDLYDGAGIYITFCENAIVRHNFIRDIIDKPGAGSSAYYLDEKAVNCLVEENMEINVPRASHNHIGSGNTFRNNFFIMSDRGWFTMERSDNYTFENNVVMAENGFDIWDLKFCPVFRNNVLFSGKGGLGTKDIKRYEILREYELELQDGNRNLNPGLNSYKSGKISLSSDSPLPAMGIRPIDVSDAGLIPEQTK